MLGNTIDRSPIVLSLAVDCSWTDTISEACVYFSLFRGYLFYNEEYILCKSSAYFWLIEESFRANEKNIIQRRHLNNIPDTYSRN